MLLSEPGTDPTSRHRRHPPLVSLSGVLLPAERMGAKGGVGGGARGGVVAFLNYHLDLPIVKWCLFLSFSETGFIFV